jgi:hypothetical protein
MWSGGGDEDAASRRRWQLEICRMLHCQPLDSDINRCVPSTSIVFVLRDSQTQASFARTARVAPVGWHPQQVNGRPWRSQNAQSRS